MTSLSQDYIQLNTLKSIDITSSKLPQSSSIDRGAFKARLESAYTQFYSRPVNIADHPSQKLYAEVQVNGQTVAKLYNSGAMGTSNAAYGRIKNLPSMGESVSITGPELAQRRAEEIAQALGGKVVHSSTAITQAQWQATPLIQFQLDYAAMARDVQEARANNDASARTLFLAQLLAEAGITA